MAEHQLVALWLLLIAVATVKGDWYKPSKQVSWQYQLSDSGTISIIPGVQLYVIDIDTAASVMPQLRKAVPGVAVACYFSTGSWEKKRQSYDAHRGKFKIRKGEWKHVLGNVLDGWPDERWLDIRSPKVRSIMLRRLRYAKSISCDGVDLDNNDGYQQNSGFPLTKQDQINYSKWLATAAHSLGLGVDLKNVPELVPKLKNYFDWFIVESCFTFDKCGVYTTVGDKAVLGVQYCDAAQVFGSDYATSDPSCYCPRANANGWNFLVKKVELGSEGVSCSAFCAEPGRTCVAKSGTCATNQDNICAAVLG